MTPQEPRAIDPSLPERLRQFHAEFPLAGDPWNEILAVPDDQLLYLVALLRNTPMPALALTADEWNRFFTRLSPHGIFALMSYHLRSWPAECRPPKEVTDVLERNFLAAAGTALRAGRQIQVMVDALEAAGIPSALMKGPALARMVYPHAAMRQSADIDILVRRTDVPAAEAVLEGLGYASPDTESHTSRYAYHQEFLLPAGGLLVELHWGLDCGYHLVPDGWADNALGRRIPFEASDLRSHTLSPVDHLPYLGLHHGYQHEGLRLDQVADVCRLVDTVRDPAEAGALVERARDGGLLVPLRFAAEAAALWAGTALPGEYHEPAAWPVPFRREARLWEQMKARSTSPISGLAVGFRREETIANKIRLGCRFVLPPREAMEKYRRSNSPLDIPLAHMRRWMSYSRQG